MRIDSVTRGVSALAIVAAVAGCAASSSGGSPAIGGGPPASTSPSASAQSPAEFLAGANAICQLGLKEIAKRPPFPFPSFDPAHPDTTKLHAIGVYFAKASIIRIEKRLVALTPPADLSTSWAMLRGDLMKSIRNHHAQIRAALRRNASAFVRTAYDFGAIEQDLTRDVQGVGLVTTTSCSKYLVR